MFIPSILGQCSVLGQTSNAGLLFRGGWGSGFNFSARFILPVFPIGDSPVSVVPHPCSRTCREGIDEWRRPTRVPQETGENCR